MRGCGFGGAFAGHSFLAAAAVPLGSKGTFNGDAQKRQSQSAAKQQASTEAEAQNEMKPNE